MPRPDFRAFDSRLAASHAAADHLAQVLRDTPGPVSLGLSGGSSPSETYRALLSRDVPWDRLWILWMDERCVPPTHPDSNVQQAREVFLDDAPIDESRILTPPPTLRDDPDGAAQVYQQRLRDALGEQFSVTAAVMGMGDDGHTASLFPDTDFTDLPGDVAHRLAPPSSPVLHRLTLTLGAINRAQHAVFLVFGAAKADLVGRVADGGACPDVPAACVAPRQETLWFLDSDSARSLDAST
jgi:6-phosphogluconolactonase